jgi:chemotaxis protein CheZ
MSSSQVEPKVEEDLDLSLESGIAAIKTGKVRQADSQEILQVVQTIIESMKRDVPSIDLAVRDDLEDLASYIRETKSEIMNLSPEEISDEHLPSASVELDAIVSATEKATNSIMEAAEQIEQAADGIGGEAAESIVTATTQIYEACGFQDITGQRISKVIAAMQEIEKKIDDLVGVFGDGDDQAREERRRAREMLREERRQEAITEGELLEGPQLPDAAVSQDDIDSLFDSL